MPLSQVLFLQNFNSSAYQGIAELTAGTDYVLSFYLESRYSANPNFDGTQTVQPTIDGNLMGTWTLTDFTPFTLAVPSFSVPAGGTHMLEFHGMNPGGYTAFLSGASISAQVPQSSSLTSLTGSFLILVD